MKKVKVKRIIPIFKKKRIRNNKVEGKTITQIIREKKGLDLAKSSKAHLKNIFSLDKRIKMVSIVVVHTTGDKYFPYRNYVFTIVRGNKCG